MLLTIFPSKRSSKISFQTSPEVRHQFRRKLRQLHSGNRWCLKTVRIVSQKRMRAITVKFGPPRPQKVLNPLCIFPRKSVFCNLCLPRSLARKTDRKAKFSEFWEVGDGWGAEIRVGTKPLMMVLTLNVTDSLMCEILRALLRKNIRGVPSQGGTGLDTYQICIQARFDTYQLPILI